MKKFDYKLPEALEEVLNSLEYEEVGGIVIKATRFDKDDIYLKIHVFCDSLESPLQKWEVKVVNSKTEKITVNWCNNFQFFCEHVLLAEYQDNYAELYFNDTSDKVNEIFIDIYKSLLVLGNSVDIAKYAYSPKSLELLCKQSYGLFARGPMTILSIYNKVLSKFGLKTNFMSEIESTAEHKNLKLLIIGESYFIGQDFVFNKI